MQNRTLTQWIGIMPKNALNVIAFIPLCLWIIAPIFLMISNSLGRYNPVFLNISTKLILFVLWQVGILGIIIGILAFVKSRTANDGTKIKIKLAKKEFFLKYIDRIFLLAMIVWGIFGCILAEDKQKSFFGEVYRNEGYLTYILYIGVFACACVLKSEKLRLRLFHIFSSVSLIMSICTILQFKRIPMFCFINFHGMHSAVFSNANHYGYYLTISLLIMAGMIIFSKQLWVKIAYSIAFVISTIALVANDTFAAYFAIAVALILIIIFFVKAKKATLLLAFIPLIIFAFGSFLGDVLTHNVRNNFRGLLGDVKGFQQGNPEAGTHRLQLWSASIKDIAQKPLFGFGLENMPVVTYIQDGVETEIQNDRPHNEYLQHALFMGIPAGLLYLSALVIIIRKAIKTRAKLSKSQLISLGALFAYLFSAFFGNTMYYTLPYFIIILSFCTTQNE